MNEPKRTLLQKLAAQWPCALGFLLMALGVFVIWQASGPTAGYERRGGIVIIAFGVAALGYWSFANRNDDYNF
jgi:fucose permease